MTTMTVSLLSFLLIVILSTAVCIEISDNLCLDDSICNNHLNISRVNMPQFDEDSMEIFLRDRSYSCEIVHPRSLTVTQSEISRHKVNRLLSATTNICLLPILISKDYYIIDGHHRAIACRYLNSNLSAIRLDESIHKLLCSMKSFHNKLKR